MRRHTWKTSVAAVAAAVLIMAGCGGEKKVSKTSEELPAVETGVNLVVNPGFEIWNGSRLFGWTTTIFSGEGNKLSLYGKSEKAKSGEFSILLRGAFNTEIWVALTQQFPVRPDHEIVFSADIMTENIKQNRGQEDNMCVFVRFLDGGGQRINEKSFADVWTRKRTGTNDWWRIKKRVEVPDGARKVEIGILNQMTGYAYFDNVKLVILDKIDWKSKDSKFITYNWFEGRQFPPEDMKRVSGLIEEVAKEAGIKKIEGRINYYMYPDEETFMKLLDRKKYSTLARWEKKELHDIKSFNDHEIIHLVLFDLGFPPVIVAKGFVFYFRAKHYDWDLNIRSKRFLLEKQIPALYKTVGADKWKNVNTAVVIPAWASFIEYLIDKYGMDSFKTLYTSTNNINRAEPFSKVFRDVYGIDFQKADRAWRLSILRYEGDAAADTLPGFWESQPELDRKGS